MEDNSVQNAAVVEDETSSQVAQDGANTEEAGRTENTETLEVNEETTSEQEEKKEEPPAEEKEEKEPFAAKFAALSRKEKSVRQREAEIEQRLKEVEERETRWQALQKKKEENPLEFLKENGLDYETITDFVLNGGEKTEEQKEQSVIKTLQEELTALKAQLNEDKETRLKREEEDAQKQFDAQISAFKDEINNTITSNVDKYELISAHEAQEDVFETISAYYEKHGKILDIEEAAEMVESHLEEEAKRLVNLKKIKSFLPKSEESETKQGETRSEEPKTLENAHSSQVPPSSAKRKLNAEESLAEAASVLKWE